MVNLNKINSKGFSIREAERNAAEIALKKINERKILKISLVGKTNAGKSTLLNNLVGEKISITNKKINTTKIL